MPIKINSILNIQVSAGPSCVENLEIEVEAYDKLDVKVPGGPSGTPGKASVEVQPGGPGQVKFLFISSKPYFPKELTYKVDGGTDSINLDQPQLFAGIGAASLLGKVQKLDFSNGAGQGKDAVVQIIVGRKAIT